MNYSGIIVLIISLGFSACFPEYTRPTPTRAIVEATRELDISTVALDLVTKASNELHWNNRTLANYILKHARGFSNVTASTRQAIQNAYSHLEPLRESPEYTQARSEPIAFYKGTLTKNSIGTPEINLYVVNMTNKAVDAFVFEASCRNRFEEDLGTFRGISQEVIQSSEPYLVDQIDELNRYKRFRHPYQTQVYVSNSRRYTWTLYTFDLTTVVRITLVKVHFVDGTTWVADPTKVSIQYLVRGR